MEQNKAAHLITGCYASTPTEKLLIEANLVPLKERGKILATKAREKYKRDPSNPNHHIVNSNINPKTEREKEGRSWRPNAKASAIKIGIEKLKTENIIKTCSVPPWHTSNGLKLFPNLIDGKCKREDKNELKRLVEETIKEKKANADMIIYTDGSVQEDQKNGGSGCFITSQDSSEEEISSPAGKICSSFRAEVIAIHKALEIASNRLKEKNVVIFTDSQSVIRKLEEGPTNNIDWHINEIWKCMQTLDNNKCKVTIQWVPGHEEIEGNERVDEIAKKATTLPQSEVKIDYKTVKAATNREIENNWKRSIDHLLWKPGSQAESNFSREERCKIAQIRTGHSLSLKAYQKRLGKIDDDTCERCKLEEEDRDHLLFTCPASTNERLEYFGHRIMPPNSKVNPTDLRDFLKKMGRL